MSCVGIKYHWAQFARHVSQTVFFISCPVARFAGFLENRKKWGHDFSEWWNAVGFPIWAIVGGVLVVIALARGWFHHV